MFGDTKLTQKRCPVVWNRRQNRCGLLWPSIFTILSAVAEAERDRIREDIRDVRTDQRGRGGYLGGKLPFGWTLGGSGGLVKDRAQQEAIKIMKKVGPAGNLFAGNRFLDYCGGPFSLSHAGVKNILTTLQSGANC
jgi:hypothetical protein